MRRQNDHYELLGVERTASGAELRRAYESALTRASRAGATRHMVDLVAAYEVLGDPGRRSVYDRTGLAVVPERVPNTYGRATPFRGGVAAIGQRRDAVSRRAVLPPPSRHLSGRAFVVLALAGTAAATAVGVRHWPQPQAAPAPASRVVDANAQSARNGLVTVFCRGGSGTAYVQLARRGDAVACRNGAVPTWAVRAR